jgi:hypothetical protein
MNANEIDFIRRVAAETVAEIAPAEVSCFPVVWEEFIARGLSLGGARKRKFLTGLFMDDDGGLKLVSALTIWVVSEVLVEMKQRIGPVEKSQVEQAAIAAAKSMGAGQQLAAALGDRIAEKLRNAYNEAGLAAMADPPSGGDQRMLGGGSQAPECVAWFREPGEDKLKRCEGRRQQIEAQFELQKERFDFFVNCLDGNTWHSNAVEPISLEPRTQLLLALFLLHCGQPIDSRRAVSWAWPSTSIVIGASPDKVQSNLKVAVREIKNRLHGLNTFDIPKKPRDGHYCCRGKLSFCVLLPGLKDQQLASLRLQPQI